MDRVHAHLTTWKCVLIVYHDSNAPALLMESFMMMDKLV